MYIGWSGASTIDGKLVALGSLAGGDGGPAGTWIADQPITLARGQAATQAIALSPASQAGTLAGAITLPAGLDLIEKQLFLRLPIVHASIPLPVPQDGSPSFSLTVPDLSALGGELCVGAVASPGPVNAEICGVTVGDASVKLDLAPPPRFVLGDGGVSLTSSSSLSWTSAGPGVFLFQLTSENPNAQVPNVYVFTTDGSAGWPDLTAAGVSFPEGIEYHGSVATMGSYSTMDEALGSDGIANPFPTSLQRSYSARPEGEHAIATSPRICRRPPRLRRGAGLRQGCAGGLVSLRVGVDRRGPVPNRPERRRRRVHPQRARGGFVRSGAVVSRDLRSVPDPAVFEPLQMHAQLSWDGFADALLRADANLLSVPEKAAGRQLAVRSGGGRGDP